MGVLKLLDSSKAVMMLVVFLTLCVMVAAGRLSPELLENFLEIVMPSWLLAHAGEQGAKALAGRPKSDAADKGA
jgi:hypothetical protein